MTPKEAIATAKAHISEIFVDEIDYGPKLEEIWFDDEKKEWYITLTVWRKFYNPSGNPLLTGPSEMKLVRIRDADGRPVAILNHVPMAF